MWVTLGIVAGSSQIIYFSPIRHLCKVPEQPAALDHVLQIQPAIGPVHDVRANVERSHPHAHHCGKPRPTSAYPSVSGVIVYSGAIVDSGVESLISLLPSLDWILASYAT